MGIMHDLSKTTVEYVCKHFPSPNIARKYGHKLDGGCETGEVEQAPFVASTAIHVERTGRLIPRPPSVQSNSSENFWSSSSIILQGKAAQKEEFLVEKTYKKPDIPSMFLYHQNTAKNYLRCWN